MLLVPALVFLFVLASVVGVYYFTGGKDGGERADIQKRLSLFELRRLQEADLPDILKDDFLSDVPFLNRFLSRLNLAVAIDRQIKQADMKMRVGVFALLTVFLFVLGIMAGYLAGWPLLPIPALGVLLALGPWNVVRMKRRLRLKKFMALFPDALEMFARSLRAGHSFMGAVQLVSQEMPDPVGAEFRKAFDEQNMGVPIKDVLIGMTDRIDSLDVKFFVTAILIQRETGGNLAEIIDKIAHVVRERFRIEGQVKVFTAQARMTGTILVLLPMGVAAAVSVLNPEYLKPLWQETVGRYMIGTAAVMQIMGGLVIRKIIRIKI